MNNKKYKSIFYCKIKCTYKFYVFSIKSVLWNMSDNSKYIFKNSLNHFRTQLESLTVYVFTCHNFHCWRAIWILFHFGRCYEKLTIKNYIGNVSKSGVLHLRTKRSVKRDLESSASVSKLLRVALNNWKKKKINIVKPRHIAWEIIN